MSVFYLIIRFIFTLLAFSAIITKALSLLEPLNNGCQQTLNALAQELAFDLLRSEEDNV